MSSLQNYIESLNIMNSLTDEYLHNTLILLDLYAPLVRHSARLMDELTEECFESRRQSVTDFINLAIDCDRDPKSRYITERLIGTGHSMYLLEVMEEALMIVRDVPRCGDIYYKILNARYFDCCCKSNEDAFLQAGISASTYYRHIKNAQKYYAAILWCIVVPDIIASQRIPKPYNKQSAVNA